MTQYPEEVAAFLKEWQTLAKKYDLRKIIALTGGRQKKLNARMKNKIFRENWRKAFKIIPDCPFLIGVNKSLWAISFDYLIKNDTNLIEIVEGKFKTRRTKPSETRGVGELSEWDARMRKEFDEIE